MDAVVPVRVENGWHGLAWDITTSDGIDPSTAVESRFDAVMVCNGFVSHSLKDTSLSFSISEMKLLKMLDGKRCWIEKGSCKYLICVLSVFHQTLL